MTDGLPVAVLPPIDLLRQTVVYFVALLRAASQLSRAASVITAGKTQKPSRK